MRRSSTLNSVSASTSTLLLALALATSVFSSGCLKTRSQVRESDAPAPAKVEDVKPEGGYVVEELKSELMRLSGRIEELERSKAQQEAKDAKKDSTETIKKLELRIQELEKAQADLIESLKRVQSAPPVDPQQVFDSANEKYKSKNWDEAIEGFGRYLKTAAPKRADEAIYLRGEAFFAKKDFRGAVNELSQISEKFPKSKWMPKALLRIALSFDGMSNRQDAKAFYQLLIDEFPKTEEARTARSKLKKSPGQ